MHILFCNISWMKYYKGIFEGVDEPVGGGDYVRKRNDAHEKYNFEKESLIFEDDSFESGEYCLGFVETKETAGKRNQLHIEKIKGCEHCENEDSVSNILAVYCAVHPDHKFTTVVGWYNHATVYRNYLSAEFESYDKSDDVYYQYYNAIAEAKDCVLLPICERSKRTKWNVPRKQAGASYGFGRANVWFAKNLDNNHYLDEYLKRLVNQIQQYDGENWLDMYPKE